MITINKLVTFIKPILDDIHQPITIVDHKGHFVYYNLISARMDGTDPDEVIGKHLLEISQWISSEQSTLLQCLKDQKTSSNIHQVYQIVGGQEKDYIHSVTPLFDDYGHLIGAIEIGRSIQEQPSQTQSKQKKPTVPNIITNDPLMLQEMNKTRIFARTNIPIIIFGETGTGKELFAKKAHALSLRNTRPMMSLNCAAIPETLLESILFGTVKGAFTGAENKKGLFSLANGGTLFLDEINSMPISLQSKLLRVLQDGHFLPLGAQITEYSDVRLITAMNQDPSEAIHEGKLREDFYYRLNTGEIYIPPLRNRPDDIILLAQSFVAQFAPELQPKITMLDTKAHKILTQHQWPGNVRELQNAISRSLLLHKNGSKLSEIILGNRLTLQKNTETNQATDLQQQLIHEESTLIRNTLIQNNGNKTKSAKALGIPRTTLNSKIKKLGISLGYSKT